MHFVDIHNKINSVDKRQRLLILKHSDCENYCVELMTK